MSRTSRRFSAVRTEGGLLPHDILTRTQSGDPDLAGTAAGTYHLGPNERIGEAANRAWSRMVAIWHAFQEALEKEADASLATGVTRERWLLPLFQELGYGRLPKGTAIEVEGKSYAVSHTWHHSPIHLLGCRVDLDRRQKGVAGAATSSPHGLVQDFLNRSDAHLWGFVTNGYQLRVLRDHHSLTRQAYVEFDLQAIMDGEQYSEFLLLWLVCHQSRVEADTPEECWLETWVNISRDEGVRALDKLRDGVEKAIEAFGTGFLAHKANTRLKAALESGELDSQEYYRQILRLVYRLIFLFVAEERDALLDPNATEEARERYRRYYATRRIRDLADKRRGSPHGDLWRGIALVMEKLDDGYPELGLPALGSMLWGEEACPWLMGAECANDYVLTAVRFLSHIQDGKARFPVNWRNVGADELGSIYEGLLELHPRMHKDAGRFELDTAAGHERKKTGSYYTPTPLVDCLLDSALDPVLDEACKRPDPEAAILNLKVCDPACGSGHFLVAAARRIAKRLAIVYSGDNEPSPKDIQTALRDVVGRCVYGVDLNPMAVELCKVSLWVEAIEPGRPLSFLDSHIQCGDALLGATPALMSRGIPDDAFKPNGSDDKEVAKRLKRRNRDERKGQTTLFGLFAAQSRPAYETVTTFAEDLEKAADDSIAAVRNKEQCWNNLSRSPQYKGAWFLADAWCSSFVWPKRAGDLEAGAITEDSWRRLEQDVTSAPPLTRNTVRSLAKEYRFFHWHLAFPHVFKGIKTEFEANETTGWVDGFDVVAGNPPWEKIHLRDQEFFSSSSPEIANAPTKAKRRKLIEGLNQHDPELFLAYEREKAKHDNVSGFLRLSGCFPLTGVSRINLYSVFAETALRIVSPRGRFALILASGILTDDNNKHLFDQLVSNRQLDHAWDFENSQAIFPDVHRSYKFALVSGGGADLRAEQADFAFYLKSVADLRDEDKHFSLSARQLALLNPNTKGCPTFRSRRDALTNLHVYERTPAVDTVKLSSDWPGTIKTPFNSANDSKHFKSWSQLASEAARFSDNHIASVRGDTWLPIYEPKFIHQFSHRFAGFVHAEGESQSSQIIGEDALSSPSAYVSARNWLPESLLAERFPGEWFLILRNITGAQNERTSIAAIIPRRPCVDANLLLGLEAKTALMICANLNSFAYDYLARQKIAGTHFNQFIWKQIPLVRPDDYVRASSLGSAEWISRHALELTYTAWDLAAFALDYGYAGPPFRWENERRFLLRCELDAAYFHLYLGSSMEWGRVSPQLAGMFQSPRAAVEHIMESFPIVQRRDIQFYGDYRSKLQILEIYDAMQRAAETGKPFQSVLAPSSGDARFAHPDSTRPDWAQVTQ